MNLDDDVLARARAIAATLRLPFRGVVNEALRAGLSALEDLPRSRIYRTGPHKMGLKAGRDLDDIQALLSQVEGEGQP